MRIVVGITGSSGSIYGVTALELLKEAKVETYLIVTKNGWKVIRDETDLTEDYVRSLAFKYYDESDFDSPLASGSFEYDGLLISPCSMSTVAKIANGISDNLLTRVADVCIKEKRKVVLMPRETPLSSIHLKNLLRLSTNNNVVIMPPMPPFYLKPKSIEDLVNYTTARALSYFGIRTRYLRSWK
jgi:4-hydroxy-3-polyprenylbenzoate decarboxylase